MTYCPACGAALATPRSIDGQAAATVMTASGARPAPGAHRRSLARRLVPVVLAVALGVAALLLLSPDFRGQFFRAVTPSCSVGLNGAAVSVTIQGADAEAQCNSFLRRTTDGGSWYVYSGGQQPAGATICQVNYTGDLFTVRDQGSLNIYGSSICQNLVKLANGQSVTTTTTDTSPPGNAQTVGCGLQVYGHDATVLATRDVCAAFERAYPPADGHWTAWSSSSAPAGDTLVCSVSWQGAVLWIWDSGGQYYGTDLCRRLGS
jgi:hypothetical protein